jgi:nitrous oxidase accessory protein
VRASWRVVFSLGSAALLLGVAPTPRAHARTIEVSPAPGSVAAAIATAEPGDVVLLRPGTYAGPLEIARAITLRGEPGAVIDGGGRGTVLRVTASGASVENVTLRGSGGDVQETDAGIHVASASLVALRGLVLSDVLYGIYGERSEGLLVENCRLTGRVTPSRESGSGDGNGNGIHLWYSPDARLERNTIERYQDGIYLSFANHTHVAWNRLRDCGRYGLHTMYCQATQLVENLFTRNVAGCAIMFSDHLLVERNAILHNRGSRTYGLLLRDCSAGRFVGNQLVDNTVAVFMDNSNHNEIRGNLFQDNGWGLLMFSSCAGNETAGNTFMNNDYPVALDMRYSDNRFDDGRRGNFWSDNAPYDLDADGVGDIPYSPVSAFAFVSKQYPDLAILAKSPAVAAITVAERVFPALRPSEIVDRFPLISPTSVPHPRGGDDAGRARPAWAAATAFAGLLLAGTLGLAWKGRAG